MHSVLGFASLLPQAMPLYDHLAQRTPEYHPKIVRTRRDLNAEKRDQLKITLKAKAQADLPNHRVWFVCSILVALLLKGIHFFKGCLSGRRSYRTSEVVQWIRMMRFDHEAVGSTHPFLYCGNDSRNLALVFWPKAKDLTATC